MNDGILLVANEDGKFEVYDDTYDITIHCRTQEEQNRVCSLLHKVENLPNEVSTERAAEILVGYCKGKIDGCSKECLFARESPVEGALNCAINAPENWILSEEIEDEVD